jgi:hypothetical protein
MVADELAAAVGEDGWAAAEACAVLLAVASRESPDATPVRNDAPADPGAASPNRLTRVKRICWGKRAQAWSGVREMRRNGSFSRLHIDTSPPQRAPEWKLMRRRTIWFICKGLGCIRVPIREIKMEIPDKTKKKENRHGE